ncbi:hypothetical protein C882_2360 [Caenispirillum salinarum AK4]|uniref:Uncharacterized protein n=1 Tax=Caenispirillum salinarum AK4 TaxID=1238182 RepID=K9HPT0_9PROT|nr:hypothetical protein C882_2360 [Caenispirillum salinarum AK4]
MLRRLARICHDAGPSCPRSGRRNGPTETSSRKKERLLANCRQFSAGRSGGP